VHGAAAVDAPRRHRRVAAAVGDPEVHLFFVVAIEDVVEGRCLPQDRDAGALLDEGSAAARPVGAVAVEAAELLHESLAAGDGLGVELLDEALLAVLLTQEIEGERHGEEGGQQHRRLLAGFEAPGLQLVVGDARGQVGGDLFGSATAQRVDQDESQPSDPADGGQRDDDVGRHASATDLGGEKVVSHMHEGPRGYSTDGAGARGVSTIVPVWMMKSLLSVTSTTNRSRLRGAGPAKYSPISLYLEPWQGHSKPWLVAHQGTRQPRWTQRW